VGQGKNTWRVGATAKSFYVITVFHSILAYVLCQTVKALGNKVPEPFPKNRFVYQFNLGICVFPGELETICLRIGDNTLGCKGPWQMRWCFPKR
jgi:hypothetical protein